MKNSILRRLGTRFLFGRQRATLSWRLVAAAAGLSLASQLPAQAQTAFPINEPFTGSSTSNFFLGAGANSKAASLGNGYLRLTDNTNNQAGYAVLKKSFPSPQGFSISFEFFSFNGSGGAVVNQTTGADGFSVFLVDADGTDPATAGQFSIGAFGGSLGYAQKTAASQAVDTDRPGASKGYLGIGLDEFGNYSNPTEGRIGGPGLVPQAIVLRGPGTGITGYNYLTGGTVGFPLSFPASTTEAQSTSSDYRKAYIFVIPVAGGGYNVTVRIQNGPSTVTTTTYNFPISTPPANLRVGFAGSTGGATNIHEIRNLAILANPIAIDDANATKYNVATTFSIVANDKGVGAVIAPGTVDLDPSTIAIDKTLTVPGKGIFTVDNNGAVTFTPSGTFSGVFTIPYTVNDLLGAISNPAAITITVTGADVATTVSGPATANPGAQVTYTVNTVNNGSETALNVSPTLQLPAGVTIPASANYTVSASNLVTFTAVTIASGGTASNSVTFAVPATGTASITATSGYSYPANAAIPDIVPGNNTATLTTTVAGSLNVAALCSVPGRDGPVTLTAGATPNTYYAGTGTANAGSSTITVSATPNPTTGNPIAAGDLLLVMQMQGATMNTSNTTTYGTITAASTTAGLYEYAVAASAVSSTTGNLTLVGKLTNTYTNSTIGSSFQVIRIPQYSSLTVNGQVTGPAWDGTTGGVLALEVAGATNFNGGSLNMDGKGFRGGAGRLNTSGGNTTTYAIGVGQTAYASKGEGIAGTPLQVYVGGLAVSGGTSTYENNGGSFALGQPATGGGGATSVNATQGNTTSSYFGGGGGGANGSTGGAGQGDFRNNANTIIAPGGDGGVANPAASATRFYLGGGGGAGTTINATAFLASSGGTGGGIIILRSGGTTGTAAISASGTSGQNLTNYGGGGGGAGGTVAVFASSGLNNLTVTANGGAGGTSANNGNGGGGSGGVLFSNAPTNTNSRLSAGSNGTGAAGNTASTATSIGGSCIPALTVELTTSTPNVTRPSSGSAPNPASYTAIISNTGGTAQNSTTTLSMDGLFTQDNTLTPTVTLITANGTTTTLAAGSYTLTGTGTSTLVFSGITIPAGSTLKISYRALIAKTAIGGTAYQASSSVTFLDPTRTANTGTATPGGTFTSGGGTVPGANYLTTTSTLEDVSIVAPLPVELTRFEVLAVRQDALLTWSTASERHNDHFTVERSLTGSSFVTVGTVRGQGNSVQNTNYTFTDTNAGRLAATKVYYRLKQVDLDGTASYSPVRAVQFAAAKAAASLYPNPSQGQAVLDLSGLAQGNYSVQVLDLTGRVLRTQKANAEAAPLDLSGLPQGAYMVLVQGAGVRQTLPLLRN